MITFLVKERNEADNELNDEEKGLYEREFEKMGFTKVEFYRIIRAGTKRVVRAGTELCKEGARQEKMFFLLDGKVDVMKEDKKAKGRDTCIAVIQENAFIGEMSFLTFFQEEGEETKAEATCVTSSDSVVMEWDFERLASYLGHEANRGVANALQTKLCNDLRRKLHRQNESA